MKIEVQNAKMASVSLLAFVELNIREVFGRPGNLGKGDPVKFPCNIKDAFPDVIQLKIGFQCLLIQIKFFLHDLVAVIPPVPTFKLKILTLFPDQRLHIVGLPARHFKGGGPNLIKQVVNIFGLFRHAVIQSIGGIRIETQQRGFLLAERDQSGNDGLVVLVVIVVAATDVSAEDLLPVFPVVREL